MTPGEILDAMLEGKIVDDNGNKWRISRTPSSSNMHINFSLETHFDDEDKDEWLSYYDLTLEEFCDMCTTSSFEVDLCYERRKQ